MIRPRGAKYQVSFWGGACNQGTVNFAELQAYVAPVMWLWQAEAKRIRLGRPVHLHVCTDSQYIARAGNRQCSRQAQAPAWAMFDFLKARGFVTKWHWLPRNETPWNTEADKASKVARLRLEDYTLLRAE